MKTYFSVDINPTTPRRSSAGRGVAPDRRLSSLGRIACAGALLACSVAAYGEGAPVDAGREAAQAAASPAPAVAAPAATPAIPAEEVAKINAILQQFSTLFEQQKFAEAGKVLEEAEKLAPESEAVISARAGILAETGEISKARTIYESLTAAHPKAFVPKYNLAELFSLQKKYGEARRAFEALLKEFPDSGLVQFKIVLTYLAEKNEEGAAQAVRALEQPTPTPFMYYGAAAVAIYGGNITKGKQMILAAENDFGPGRQKLLHDSLAEIGLVIQSDYPPQKPEPEEN